MEVQSVAGTPICQDSGIDSILSRQPLNVTDTGALHMAEETETYGRAFEDFVNIEYFGNVPITLQPGLLVSSSGTKQLLVLQVSHLSQETERQTCLDKMLQVPFGCK